ncbi:MAG TPA: TonB family protein [Kofleriaceae bacterium]|jgi:TonB family protein
MTATPHPRYRVSAARQSRFATTLGVSILVHVALLGTAVVTGVALMTPQSADAAEAEPVAVVPVDLKDSCAGNIMLAAVGRHAMCYSPWRSDTDDCLHDAQMSLWIDLSGCSAANDPSTAVSVVEQKQSSKLKPIDAEKLLEDAAKPKPKPVEIVKLPEPHPEQPKAAAPPPPPAPPKPAQVVENMKPDQEQDPVNARYLAEWSTKVEKQTVARGAADEKMVAKSQPKELTPTEHPKDDPSVHELETGRMPGKNIKAPDVPGTLSMRAPGSRTPGEVAQDEKVRGTAMGAKGPLLADGYMPRRGDGLIEQQRRERSEMPQGQNGAGGGVPPVANLKPTEDVLQRHAGGGNVDHMDDVENGDETALNAKKWVYASFFNRLKRQVAQNWDPGSVWRRTDPTGQVFGSKTRITEVRVSLSRSGSLAKIVITQPSGAQDLDEEAVRAFHAAAPFPNPPEGLVEKDNLITFAFSFYFEIGGPPSSWRVVRSM